MQAGGPLLVLLWCRPQPSGAAEDEDRTGTPQGWRWSCLASDFLPSRCLTCVSLTKNNNCTFHESWQSESCAFSKKPRRVFIISLALAALSGHKMHLSSFH